MPPSNSSSIQKSKLNCVMPTTSNCVEWAGEDLPIIDICKGDSISDVEYKVALVIQSMQQGLDLTDLDISCLLTDCTNCPQPEKYVKTVITLLTQKYCELKEIVDSISGSSSSTLPTVNLSCLAYKNAEGDTISQAVLDTATRLIIQELCIQKEKNNTQDSAITNHETRIITLENRQVNFTIPQVTSDCLFSGVKSIETAYDAIDTDYCNYKSVLGTASAFQQAFSKVCKDLNTKLGSQSGWTPTPTTLAQYFSNLYILGCNVLSRVELIERNCCASGCDAITIGFICTFSGSTVTLRFSKGAGTYIPDGFEDGGSVLTITNQDNITFSAGIIVEQDVETEEIDVSSFTVGDTLVFNIDLKMSSDDLSCEKCISKTVKYTSNCCVITNTSSEDITIVYETIATTYS